MPLHACIAEIDFLVCHGYKHLLCPRGVAFLHLWREHWDRVPPWFANWRTGTILYDHAYGGALDALAGTPGGSMSPPAWHAWAGAEPSLAHLVEWQATGLPDEVKGLAGRLAAGVGRPEPPASIVSLRVHDAEVAERALAEAGVRCAARGGNIRLSPHIYNTEADIDQPIAAVARFLT